MTLRHLKIYVAVCKTKGITSAAEELHLAQPSVSLAVSELEQYYGIRLFDRISRRLYITEAGKKMLQYALHIVSLFDEMEDNVKDWSNIGTLRIGSSITVGSHILPSCIREFQEKFSDIQVKVTIHNSYTIMEQVLANEIDFAIIEGKASNPYIIAEQIMDDNLVFVCSVDHPLCMEEDVTIEQLASEKFILREKGSAGREYFDSMMKLRNITIEPIWESVSTHAIINGVMENFGISLLPALLVEDYIKKGRLHEISTEPLPLSRQFSVIYHKNKFLSESAKEFIRICKEFNLDHNENYLTMQDMLY